MRMSPSSASAGNANAMAAPSRSFRSMLFRNPMWGRVTLARARNHRQLNTGESAAAMQNRDPGSRFDFRCRARIGELQREPNAVSRLEDVGGRKEFEFRLHGDSRLQRLL